MYYKTYFFSISIDILIIVPNLLNVVFKNSSVIALLPPTNIVIPLRGGSGTGSGELEAGEVVFEEVEETKLLYKFCNSKIIVIVL